jgi:hypothetical protein
MNSAERIARAVAPTLDISWRATTAAPAADYSAAAGKNTQTTRVSSRIGNSGTAIFQSNPMVRSVLVWGAGARDALPSDVTDRDRDESSRRAISAWVRTNPQTQVR